MIGVWNNYCYRGTQYQHLEREPIIVVYARVFANENLPNLDSQAERLCAC
jgi:predicted site-specific integrase-resolvase